MIYLYHVLLYDIFTNISIYIYACIYTYHIYKYLDISILYTHTQLFHTAVGSNNWMYPFMELVPVQKEKCLHYFSLSYKRRKFRTGKVTNDLNAETACI